MRKYMDFNSGEVWTEEEIKVEYESFKDEMSFLSYEDYFEEMLRLGACKEGGLVEVD